MKNETRAKNVREAKEFFETAFGRAPAVVAFAPGRVNLIGEHTDYNEGLVLPMAVDKGVLALMIERAGGKVRARSREFADEGVFDVSDRSRTGQWFDGVKGVLDLLEQKGAPLSGLDVYVSGDLPAESGLSSSAAFLVSLITAAFRLASIKAAAMDIARAAHSVENKFLGVPCGILDQTASAACREGHALLLDCRDFSSRDIPVPDDMTIVVGNTGVRRKLASGKYEERVRECAEAVHRLQWAGESVKSLRDANVGMLERHAAVVPDVPLRRARHVVNENVRVFETAEALRHGNLRAIGKLLDESHASLRDLYEVSCMELNAMVRAFASTRRILGARLVGAGFGGCAIGLLKGPADQALLDAAAKYYFAESGREGCFFVARPGPGAGIIDF